MRANGSMLQNEPMQRKYLIAVGLNPAWQKTLLFDEFIPGEVNRAASISTFPAGKAINFARASNSWGCNSMVCHFLGGDTGKKIAEGLKSEKISHFAVWLKSPTRTCTTCLSSRNGQMTELIEPSADVPASSVESLRKLIIRKISSCSGIALCGTYPGGVGQDFYADIAEAGMKMGRIVLLDGYKGVDKTLRTGVSVLKINRSELNALAGEKDLAKAARKVFKRYNIGLIALTAGPSKAYLFERNNASFEYRLPDVGRIENPIGAGDTVSGVLLCELVKGTCPADAFRKALGAGTASCLRLKSAEYSRSEALRISRRIICVRR